MRTLRLLSATVVISLLLGGSVGAVAAQVGTDPMAPAFFSFTTEYSGVGTLPEGMVVRDHEVRYTVEATDPRASGLMTANINSNLVGWSSGAVITAVTTERLVNEGGSWSGSGRFVMAGAVEGGMASMYVLTGEDGYEGLTLIMGQSTGAGRMSSWGVIVPSDQMPPMPDAPSAE